MLPYFARSSPVVTIKLISKDGTVRLEVHAKPRAKQSRIVGPREGAIEVAIAAPPVDGAANEELVRVLASMLEIPRRNVEILRGATSQKKLVAVRGRTEDEIRDRLVPAEGRDGRGRGNVT